MGTTIYAASTASVDLMWHVYIVLNSFKQLKQPDTIVQYYLFVPSESIPDFQEYLTGIPDETFRVTIMDIDWFADRVNCPIGTPFHYARCLFADVFLQLDKILWLDVDLVFMNGGIEELWNMDLDTDYIAACLDPTIQYVPWYNRDLDNTGTDEYINSGVMLMNLAQIRADGANEEMADWVLHWIDRQDKLKDYVYDQTLINYLWQDRIKLVDTKFNNSVLAALPEAEQAYRQYIADQGYESPVDSVTKAVILHFCGLLKPWKHQFRCLPKSHYPFHDEAIAYWDKLAELYGPGPQMQIADSEGIYPPMTVTAVEEDTGLSLTVQAPTWWTEGF